MEGQIKGILATDDLFLELQIQNLDNCGFSQIQVRCNQNMGNEKMSLVKEQGQ
jgi:hypothetical protein